ncbi:MAG: single-stranded-DNA-specific exonuclease RecJ [Geobacter sp.]|nr:single-stranded-DNA-specific exonuclease RecJ [Geobacter sp.]
MEPVSERRWNIKIADDEAVGKISAHCSVSPLLALLLANRGMIEPLGAARFLSSTLSDLHDPFILLGMDAAVGRLCAALERGEKVCIHGDYDVDGVTSVALLASFMRAVGFHVFYHIPLRLEDGYGLSSTGLQRIAGQGAKVVVTVDCGITAMEEAKLARSLGIDLIITDHHTPGELLPEACAVINPLQPGCTFPCKTLAGVGVAFNLMIALRSRLRDQGCFAGRPEPNLRQFLDLVALGTVADVVPLLDENRIFVKYGLAELTSGERLGVRALKDVAGVDGEVGCGAVGFRLAPRLNAAGRLEDAAPGVELLLTGDPQAAAAIAADLDTGNVERQALERRILQEAVSMVKGNPKLKGKKSIVLASDEWHPGVIGIVASRIVEMFHRPTILIALQDGNGKGSGRSIPRFHLYDALKACSEHLLKFGGHKHAAGLSIDEAILEEFTERFDEVAAGVLSPEDLTPELMIDAELSPADLTLELVGELASLKPFGMGNPEPVFVCRGMEVEDARILKEQHLKLRVAAGGLRFDAIAFNMASRKPTGRLVDIAFTLDINTWNGRQSLQLKVKDIKEAGNRQ